MKKLRVVVPTVVLAVAMMGAGYAAWNDQVNINNDVSTGTFGFEFIDPPEVLIEHGANVTASTAKLSDGVDTITLSNLYPGVIATVNLPIDNTSSIDAVITNYELTGLPDGLTSEETVTANGVEVVGGLIPAGEEVNIQYVITADDSLSVLGGSYADTIQPSFTQVAE